MTSPTAQLSSAGVSIWLDDLSRERITSGNLAELITTRDVTGVTTNPTIFAGALSNGAAYADSVAELAAQDATTDQAIFSITTRDVQEACDEEWRDIKLTSMLSVQDQQTLLYSKR